jgi:hypothetical protein
MLGSKFVGKTYKQGAQSGWREFDEMNRDRTCISFISHISEEIMSEDRTYLICPQQRTARRKDLQLSVCHVGIYRPVESSTTTVIMASRWPANVLMYPMQQVPISAPNCPMTVIIVTCEGSMLSCDCRNVG